MSTSSLLTVLAGTGLRTTVRNHARRSSQHEVRRQRNSTISSNIDAMRTVFFVERGPDSTEMTVITSFDVQKTDSISRMLSDAVFKTKVKQQQHNRKSKIQKIEGWQ